MRMKQAASCELRDGGAERDGSKGPALYYTRWFSWSCARKVPQGSKATTELAQVREDGSKGTHTHTHTSVHT